jgi:hypothetical protein
VFTVNSPPRHRWTPWYSGRLRRLDLDATTAVTRIVDAFENTHVDLGSDGIAWGQYLDSSHFSDSQWGFYGTSAGLQVSAIRARLSNVDPSTDDLLQRVIALPDDADTTAPLFADKKGKGDFDNVIKLAAIAEAFDLDHDDVPTGTTPPLVEDLLDAVAGGTPGTFWSTRLADDPARRKHDRDFPTAFVICALRRYEVFRQSELWHSTRRWLANRVLHDAWFRTPTNCALAGLALMPHPAVARTDPDEVLRGLERCVNELTRWTREQHTIVIDRPIFNGFSIGKRNDYIFLHPELVAAVLFLELDNPPATRRFVLRVVEALSANTLQWQGFMGQSGMISSVDQLWAARLLSRFIRRREKKQPFLPTVDSYLIPSTRRGRLLWGALLVAISIGFSVFFGWPVIASSIIGALLIVVGIFWSE